MEDSAGNTVKMVRIDAITRFWIRAGPPFPDEHENGQHWSRSDGGLSIFACGESKSITMTSYYAHRLAN